MPVKDLHKKPFDEGTLTKLKIFDLYCGEWLPVFLSKIDSRFSSIHIYDFFAGPGIDSNNIYGSPLRFLKHLKQYQNLDGWKKVDVHVHFFDKDSSKIKQLKKNIAKQELELPKIKYDIEPLGFEVAFERCASELTDRSAAKLVFIDQNGVGHLTDDVFTKLVSSPNCDFLFFISSSILHRFKEHPAIKQKIVSPNDYNHVHRAALEYYRSLLSPKKRYFLAPFSIKKGANIYGLIFGSAHPLGIDKFIQIAWQNDEVTGEADFNIDRENIQAGQLNLPLPECQPSKISDFEVELENLLREGKIANEVDVMQVCFNHGVKRKHAEPILVKLKKENILDLGFRVPDIKNLKSPRPIHLKKQIK